VTSTLVAPQTRDGDQAVERVWRTELSPVSFLVRAAEVHAGATAPVHGGRRCSYRELHERVARLTSALRGLGVERGDRVAVLVLRIRRHRRQQDRAPQALGQFPGERGHHLHLGGREMRASSLA
jgi:non-ribosomal peptide synthetase component F